MFLPFPAGVFRLQVLTQLTLRVCVCVIVYEEHA